MGKVGTTPPDGPATTPVQTAIPPPAVETVSALGGSVGVLCQDRLASVVWVQPAPGFTNTDDDRGPADQIKVKLTSSSHESEIKASCWPNGFEPSVKEKAK